MAIFLQDMGFIEYKGSSITNTTPALQTQQALFDKINGTDSQQQKYSKGKNGCNISFGDFFKIDFNLSNLSLSDLFQVDTDFDTSLFDKLDLLSTDVAMINAMLINAISDMDCCDIAGQYNTTMVPFMQFFCDAPAGASCQVQPSSICTNIHATYCTSGGGCPGNGDYPVGGVGCSGGGTGCCPGGGGAGCQSGNTCQSNQNTGWTAQATQPPARNPLIGTDATTTGESEDVLASCGNIYVPSYSSPCPQTGFTATTPDYGLPTAGGSSSAINNAARAINGAGAATESLVKVMVKAFEGISITAGILEIIDCLMPLLPGNPWIFPWDVNPLQKITAPLKDAKPFLNSFMSGELVDIVGGPVHELRQNLQMCLSSSTDLLSFDPIQGDRVGSPEQLQKLSKVAVGKGKSIVETDLYKPIEPKKPRPEDYRGGETSATYLMAMESYEASKKKYLNSVKFYQEALAEAKRQTEAQISLSQSVAVATKTNETLKLTTDGLCGCLAKALGLNNSETRILPIRTSKDLQTLIGTTIRGLTNKDAKTTSKNRPKDEEVTIQKDDLNNPKTVKAIVGKGKKSGTARTTTNTKETVKIPNTYAQITNFSFDTIYMSRDVEKLVPINLGGTPYQILLTNNKANDQKEELQLKTSQKEVKLRQIDMEDQKKHAKYKAEALNVLSKCSNINTMTTNTRIEKLIQEIQSANCKIAAEIYANSILSNYIKISYKDGDRTAAQSYIPPDEISFLYPTYVADAINELRAEIRATSNNSWATYDPPFSYTASAQKIIDSLKLSTDVDIDYKTNTFYFDGGFVKKGGTDNWRCFNLLGIEYNDFSITNGAIGRNRTTVPHMAIFPTDEIGINVCINYTRQFYDTKILMQYCWDFLIEKTNENLEELLLTLEDKYSLSRDSYMSIFTKDDIFDIINEIANFNILERGQLWAKVRSINSDVYFGEEYVYEFSESSQNSIIKYNGREINSILDESPLLIAGGNVVQQMVTINNAYIKDRGTRFKKGVMYFVDQQMNLSNIGVLQNVIGSGIASNVPGKFDLHIPCTCDNIICALINQIVQYFAGLFQRLVDEMIKVVKQFLLSFFDDILKMIKSIFGGCLLTTFGVVAKLKKIKEAGNELLENMHGRMDMYPADPCFVPDRTNDTTIGDVLDPYACYTPTNFDIYTGKDDEHSDGGVKIIEIPKPVPVDDDIYVSLVGPSFVTEGEFTSYYVVKVNSTMKLDSTMVVKFKYEPIVDHYGPGAIAGINYMPYDSVAIFPGEFDDFFGLDTMISHEPYNKAFVVSIDEIIYTGKRRVKIDPERKSVKTTIGNIETTNPYPNDDETPVVIAISGPTQAYAGESASPYVVSINQPSATVNHDIIVELLYTDQSVIPGTDYEPLDRILINAGSSAVTFSIKTFLTSDIDDKRFVVSIKNIISQYQHITIDPDLSFVKTVIHNRDSPEAINQEDEIGSILSGPKKKTIYGDKWKLENDTTVILPKDAKIISGLVGNSVPGYILECNYILI